MEIHAPHGSPQSWREIFKQLSIITAGVLIALALDGIVSWFDHRKLVREALNNLHSEIADNLREVQGLFPNIVEERQNLGHADELAQMLLDKKKIEHLSLNLEFHGAELKDASRTTAEVTGAFGYMDYADVERIAAVYGLQTAFNRAQERANEHFVTAFAGASLLANPDQADAERVKQWRSGIVLTLAALTVEEQIGQQLVKRYNQALERR
jgi:hypothetical protein